MKKFFKLAAALISFALTAVSVSEALKKKEELEQSFKSQKQ